MSDRLKGIVLLVEDDAATQLTVKEVLRGDGYAVVCAAGSKEAMKLLSSLSPDAILIDYYLDQGTADPLVEYAHRRGLISRTAIMTATSHPEALAQRLRVKQLIVKPFDLETLTDTVRLLSLKRHGPVRKIS